MYSVLVIWDECHEGIKLIHRRCDETEVELLKSFDGKFVNGIDCDEQTTDAIIKYFYGELVEGVGYPNPPMEHFDTARNGSFDLIIICGCLP